MSLAPSAIIVWPSQYSPPVFREPVRTQPKMMFQGQTQYCFIQRYFLAYLRQSPQHLDFSFSCPQTLSSKFSSHNHKNSSECCTVFYTEETVSIFAMQSSEIRNVMKSPKYTNITQRKKRIAPKSFNIKKHTLNIFQTVRLQLLSFHWCFLLQFWNIGVFSDTSIFTIVTFVLLG